MGRTLRNNVYLVLFCGIMGGVAGGIIWAFLKLMSVGIDFLWDWLPTIYPMPFYTLAVCTIGAALFGCFRWKFGDYPEDLDTVMAKVKSEKRYDYSNMAALLFSALFPLLLGSSIGPEAGLTGVVVGLCYWVGDNLSFARQNTKEYSQIGAAVTLGVLFRSPLFGVFAVEEENRGKETLELPGTMKVFLYGLAAVAGMCSYLLLSKLFGSGLSGLPSFADMRPKIADYLMLAVYILLGCLLARFYFFTDAVVGKAVAKLPPIARETAGGLCLGLLGAAIPELMFSGEEVMGELAAGKFTCGALVLAGIALLKVLLTNICIQSGLKGGHFFPIIFAGVCLGYAAALLAFGGLSGQAVFGAGPLGRSVMELEGMAGHATFAAATVTAALLGGIMKKPLAVTVLLFLCFPVKLFLWIFFAAAAGSLFSGHGKGPAAVKDGGESFSRD